MMADYFSIFSPYAFNLMGEVDCKILFVFFKLFLVVCLHQSPLISFQPVTGRSLLCQESL